MTTTHSPATVPDDAFMCELITELVTKFPQVVAGLPVELYPDARVHGVRINTSHEPNATAVMFKIGDRHVRVALQVVNHVRGGRI